MNNFHAAVWSHSNDDRYMYNVDMFGAIQMDHRNDTGLIVSTFFSVLEIHNVGFQRLNDTKL